MTVNQFLDYLASYPQTRHLAVVLADMVGGRATYSRSA
jgi:hypothetical protein